MALIEITFLFNWNLFELLLEKQVEIKKIEKDTSFIEYYIYMYNDNWREKIKFNKKKLNYY